MDTKSKNNHKLAVLIILLVILLPSVGMVRLYPFLDRESSAYKENFYTDSQFLRQIIYGNYVLYTEEAQRKEGRTILPNQIFYPDLKEAENSPVSEDMEEAWDEQDAYASALTDFKNNILQEYRSWQSSFDNVRGNLEYQVLDENNQILDQNVTGSLLEDLTRDKDEKYLWGVAMQYDQGGNLTVLNTFGENSKELSNLLESLGRKDPVDDYYYESYYGSTSLSASYSFQFPQNRTFIYGMTRENANAYLSLDLESRYHGYIDSGVVYQTLLFLIVLVGLAALLIPFIRPLRTGNEKIFRAPMEAAFLGFIPLSLIVSSIVHLVVITNEGIVTKTLKQAGLKNPYLIESLSVAWNLLWWCLIFALVYWIVSCLRNVFTLGLRRYIKERTLIYRLFAWIKRGCVKVYHSFDHLDFQDKSNRTILKIVGINFIILALICSFWFFGIGALILYSIVLFFVLQKYFNDLKTKYKKLLSSTNAIAEGNLDVTIDEDLGVFEPFKGEIQKIQTGFKKVVEEEVKSERMKTDLITNVSHDLKTPLTAIITYVNLLKNEDLSPEIHRSYIDILEQKSLRLKALIEDLFEISKATSKNVTLNLMRVDIVNLLKQVAFELNDKISQSTLDFRWNLPDEKICLTLDSQKTYRVFENLLINILKYSLSHSRVYITVEAISGEAVITMKNVSAQELNFNPEEITERFVRGDSARNTEGSGLGLAIAKSFVDLQNGTMHITTDADLFKVTIRWPLEKQEPPAPENPQAADTESPLYLEDPQRREDALPKHD